MIGVVVPAHDEELHIGSSLAALLVAARHPGLAGEEVQILLVLDSCTDRTAEIAQALGVATLTVEARNVGLARAAGADLLIARGARWLGFTDADTRVSPSWLVRQLELDADAVCGSIGVDDWSRHGALADLLHQDFTSTYNDADGHRHVHGANMGVSTAAYLRAGGFPALRCSEDVALVKALEATGARIAWSAAPRVATSSRVDPRARGGFGDAIRAVIASHAACTACQMVHALQGACGAGPGAAAAMKPT
ncbi:Glycosyl transferase [Burkholderiales bacterium 8X]|nr:Glycosyl transferase [Burkholderiales bacterium 8X]